MTIHSLRSRLSTMSCPLFIRFIIMCSINMNVHLQQTYMGIRRITFYLHYLHGAKILSIHFIILKSEWVNE